MSASADAYRTRLRPHHGLLALLLAAAVLIYPIGLDAAVARFGLTQVAWALALAALSSAALPRGALAAALGIGRTPALLVAILAAATALSGYALFLRWVAALVHAVIAWVFWQSLSRDDSLIERAARFMQPAAPDFIRPYCRRVTALFAGCFLLNAAVLAALAIGSPPGWRSFAGSGVWLILMALLGIEFFVRKTHFRYYWYGGPFERVWSRWFPAEATEMGRRSAAYIQEMRARLNAADPDR